MNLPHFPFYANDFFMKTIDLTDEQVGRYIRLLCREWINGPLKNVDNDLQFKFNETPKGWMNNRLEKEREKSIRLYEQRVSAGQSSVKARAVTSVQTTAKTSARANQNQNHNYNKNQNKNHLGSDKSLTIKERTFLFIDKVFKYQGKYETQMLHDFVEYWTEYGENDKKFRAEKQTSFGIPRRLSTWKKNEEKFGGNKKGGRKFPDSFNAEFLRVHCQDANVTMEYYKHLRDLGWVQNRGEGGTTWTKKK